MGWIERLFKRKRIHTEEDAGGQNIQWEEITLKRDEIRMNDPQQRKGYVQRCMEQIQESAEELESLTHEYNHVTAYLTDMEEIEALPSEEREHINEYAKKLLTLEEERRTFTSKKIRMSDHRYRHIEQIQNEVPDGIRKLREAEDYQALVRSDLTRLDGERHAYEYRKDEQRVIIENAKGITIICLVAMGLCMLMLFFLQMMLEIDTLIGYFLTILAGTVTITVLFVKNLDAGKEIEQVERSINKLILLQNKVKIRYVNNINLLDYLYTKFDVNHSSELEKEWNRFIIEVEERKKLEENDEDLTFYQKELLKTLRRYHIKDPEVWMSRSLALLDAKEMVEIRHGYIQRRQKLRKQMEYYKRMAEMARNEVKDLAADYPEYAKEILAIVDEY